MSDVSRRRLAAGAVLHRREVEVKFKDRNSVSGRRAAAANTQVEGRASWKKDRIGAGSKLDASVSLPLRVTVY